MNVHFRGFRSDGLAYLDEQQAATLKNATVVAQDVLLNITGASIGRVCLVPDELAGARVNQHVCIIRPLQGISPKYVEAYLSTPHVQKFVHQENYGVTRQALTKGMVENLQLPIPPPAEQRRIVAKLNGLTAHTARARAELARVSHLASQLRDQTLTSAISGELTRDFRASTDTPWPKRTLQEIATVITGSTPPTVEKDRLFGGPHAFFKPTDLDAGYHVAVPRETLTEEGLCRTRSVPAGSTLVTCIGATISKAGFARVACAFNQQINAIVPNENTVTEGLFWAVSSPSFRSKIIENSSATTLPIINKGRFQQLTLAVPPIEEQREIVDRIEASFAHADRLEAEAARAAALLDRLEVSILAKAFRGELVPQDPADEPATALLDRIRTERVATPKAKRGRNAAAAGL